MTRVKEAKGARYNITSSGRDFPQVIIRGNHQNILEMV